MINRVILVGRITKEIALRKTGSGTSVASFTIACNRRFSGQGNEQQADFINCVAWRQQADFLNQYAAKGALVGVEGRIQTRTYDDQAGKRVYVTEIVCDSVQLLESRSARENRPAQPQYQQQASGYSQGYSQDPFSMGEPQSYAQDNSFDNFDTGPTLDISSDDLPF